MGDIGGRHRIFSPPPEGTAPTVPFHGRCFAQRTKAKAPAFPTPESNQRKNPNPPRVLLEEGPWRGAEDSNLFAREYCYISWPQCMCRVAHSVLKHRLRANTCDSAYYFKRADLLRLQRSVRSFVVGGYGGDRRHLRLQASGAIRGELPAMLDMDFGEFTF
jgi:hypothetical protein